MKVRSNEVFDEGSCVPGTWAAAHSLFYAGFYTKLPVEALRTRPGITGHMSVVCVHDRRPSKEWNI